MQEVSVTLYEELTPTFDEVKAKTASLVISADTLDFAAESLATAKRIATVLDEERIKVGKPNFDAYKAVNEKYNAVINPCKTLAGDIEKKIAKYNRELKEEAERKQREHEAALAEAERKRQAEINKAEKRGVEPPPAKPLPVAPAPMVEQPREKISTSFGAVKIKERWVFDILDANAIPREYLMVDEAKVKSAINHKTEPVREIAGLKIHPEE